MHINAKAKAGVTKVVQDIYNKDGSVQPSKLVEKARPKNSPAHEGFTWDTEKAAYEFNLIEARQWIRVVEIIPTDGEPAERMVNVPVIEVRDGSREGNYKPISIVCESVDEFERAREEVVSKVNSLLYSLKALDQAARGKDDTDTTAVLALLRKGIGLVEKAVMTMH
jgi:hypothetical protein